ncbi:transglutaminase superfamily protein [Blastococcus colisei]|uniref:Transglutaminase superfamily protein n=1 Tax=Blastococcus colisei TaxID=1564162 RepID=A0A543P1V3_9ACTN|nr:transglutaminase superfamily protein [Blastococcus colisei]
MLAGAWAYVALNRLRRELPQRGISAVVVRPRLVLPSGMEGIRAVLRRRGATCLERSLILQRWLASQGHPTEVVIGVSAPGEEFAAHAWLAGYGFDPESLRYKELMRLPSPSGGGKPTIGSGAPQAAVRRRRRRRPLSH